jgi:hypothetical protein
VRDRLVQRTYAAAKPPNRLRQLPGFKGNIPFDERGERLARPGQLIPFSLLGSAEPDAMKHVVESAEDHNSGLPKRVCPPGFARGVHERPSRLSEGVGLEVARRSCKLRPTTAL